MPKVKHSRRKKILLLEFITIFCHSAIPSLDSIAKKSIFAQCTPHDGVASNHEHTQEEILYMQTRLTRTTAEKWRKSIAELVTEVYN